jgi:hypothetical protein
VRGALAIIALAAVAVAGHVGPVTAEDARDRVAPYLRALEARETGEIAGRVFAEPKRPSGPPTPYAGVSVVAVPYAASLEGQLDDIKQRQRDTMRAYLDVHAQVSAARSAYERDLRAAGGGVLIRESVSDAEGIVRFTGLPAGQWLLLGWREEAHAGKVPRTPAKDQGKFAQAPVVTGYTAVSYWRTALSVRAGETIAVNLSDRAIWLTAVREELKQPDAGTGPPPFRDRR